MNLFKGINKKTILIIILDFLLTSASLLISFLFVSFVMQKSKVLVTSLGVISVWFSASFLKVILSLILGLYRRVSRYTNTLELATQVLTIVLTNVIISITARVTNWADISYWVFVVNALFSMLLFVVGKIVLLGIIDYYRNLVEKSHGARTIIVGAGRACNMLLLDIQNSPGVYNPVCIVDDDASKNNHYICGVRVHNYISSIPDLVKTYDAQKIILAIPSIEDERRKEILKICNQTKCEILELPRLQELSKNVKTVQQIKKIDFEALLGREPVRLENEACKEQLNNSVCMVTGGGGSIGSELCRQIIKYRPKRLVIVDIYENTTYELQQDLYTEYGRDIPISVEIASVRDLPKMELLFETYRPDYVFSAAAHKHVPLMETNPEEAVKNNIQGTYNTAFLSDKYDAKKFVLISTDKAVNPTNVMGCTKRFSEMLVECFAQKKSKCDFMTVRFGNVLGSHGSVIPLFVKQIESGGPVRITHPDIIRYFMTIPEAVSLVLAAGTIAKNGEIAVLDMGESVKILDLAKNLIRFYGYEPDVDIKIEFCGLRPGEKLFEELMMREEGLVSTENEKIFLIQQMETDEAKIEGYYRELMDAADRNDKAAVVSILKKSVPTFVHE